MNDILKDLQSPGHELLDELTIKFAGDSGDGIQIAGKKFAELASDAGEQVKTMPDFPAEIRAPAGTLGGVSGFQIRTGAENIYTHGDRLDVLVAMNPASLKANLDKLKQNGIIIVNEDSFDAKTLKKAGYSDNPLTNGDLEQYRVFTVAVTLLTRQALKGCGLSRKDTDRCKNFFALGLLCWLFMRSSEQVSNWIETKFSGKPELIDANTRAYNTGWNYGETAEFCVTPYSIATSKTASKNGIYRFVSGNSAAAAGLIKAARKAGVKLFLGGYPITPATEIMQDLKRCRDDDVTVFQAEDEIAAIGSAVGAAFGGALGVTSTSGPGLALMGEFVNLAVMAELPLVIIDVQRAGPSTGLPTKTEQSDLNQALYGRNGESPLPVLCASTPKDCFDVVVEASRIALRYMTPVIVLSDLYLSSGAEAWREPGLDELPEMRPVYATPGEEYQPYKRDPETLARRWAIPGTVGMEHVIGGLEKEDVTGAVSHDPLNHERMTGLREAKIAGVVREIPDLVTQGARDAEILLLGWGSTFGAITEATALMQTRGLSVACCHIRYLNPLPGNLGGLLRNFATVLVLENNLGQLANRLRQEYLVDVQCVSNMRGLPFSVDEIVTQVESRLEAKV